MTSRKPSSEDSYPLETRMEDLQILADIEMSTRAPSVQQQDGCGIRSVISKALSNTSEQLWNQTPDDFQPSDFGSRRVSHTTEGTDDTLSTWERVLKTDPTNPFIHSRILKTISENTEASYRAATIQSRFYLNHLTTFGHDCLKAPFDILFCEESETLWVSDPVSGRIVLFDTHGRTLQEIHTGLKGPMGLFNDNSGRIWVCDFHDSRIVCFDQHAHITDEIPLRALAGDCDPFLHPRFGACFDNYLILLLMESSGQGRSIVAMERSEPGVMETVFPSLCTFIPIGLEVKAKKLFVGNFDPPQIYQASSLNDSPLPCIRQCIPGQVRRFAMTADAFYISTGTYLVKTSSEGEIDYVCNLERFFHTDRVLARGLEIVEQRERHLLFIADESQSSIHCFAIRPPSAHSP